MSAHATAPFNAAWWLLDRHVEDGRGGRVAYRCGDQQMTYADLQRASWKVANGLSPWGCGLATGS
jgi:acyl-coenzyme A synthetase/AMP-(fatty) acid ligase